MKCEDCRVHLEGYFDGELDGKAALNMARHLSECFSCQAQWSELQVLRQNIAWAIEDIPLPEQLEKRVLAAVLKENWQASVWTTGILVSFLLAPLLLFLHPLSVRVLSLAYGMSRVLGRGLYVLSGVIPPVWSMGLGMAGLVVMGLGIFIVRKLVQEIPLREATS